MWTGHLSRERNGLKTNMSRPSTCGYPVKLNFCIDHSPDPCWRRVESLFSADSSVDEFLKTYLILQVGTEGWSWSAAFTIRRRPTSHLGIWITKTTRSSIRSAETLSCPTTGPMPTTTTPPQVRWWGVIMTHQVIWTMMLLPANRASRFPMSVGEWTRTEVLILLEETRYTKCLPNARTVLYWCESSKTQI